MYVVEIVVTVVEVVVVIVVGAEGVVVASVASHVSIRSHGRLVSGGSAKSVTECT